MYVIENGGRHFARIHFEALGLGKKTQTFAVKLDDLKKFLFPDRKGKNKLWEEYWNMLPETTVPQEYMVINGLYFIHYGDQGGTVSFDENKPWTACKDTKTAAEFQFPYRFWSTVKRCENYRNANLDLHLQKRYLHLCKQLGALCQEFKEYHSQASETTGEFKRDIAGISSTVTQLHQMIDQLFRKNNIRDRDFFSWFRQHEQRYITHQNQSYIRQIRDQDQQVHTVMERNLELERQNQKQKDLIRQLQQQQKTTTQPSTFSPSNIGGVVPSDKEMCQIAYDYFKKANRSEQSAVKYSAWRESRSGLIPEALGRLLYHNQYPHNSTVNIHNNEDLVQFYNRQVVPDVLVQDIERDKKYYFVDKHTIETKIEQALQDMSTYTYGNMWTANMSQLSYNTRYHLAYMVSLLNRTSQQFSTPVVDYQDLKTRLVNMINPSNEKEVVSLIRVVLRGGNHQSPHQKSVHLPSRLSLRKMDFKTPFVVQTLHNKLRNLMHQKSVQPLEYLRSFAEALSQMD